MKKHPSTLAVKKVVEQYSDDIPARCNPNGGRVTLSIGVVNVAVAPNTTILDIANYADKVVYYAKTAGKNAIYTSIRGDTAEDSSTRLLAARLRQAHYTRR